MLLKPSFSTNWVKGSVQISIIHTFWTHKKDTHKKTTTLLTTVSLHLASVEPFNRINARFWN